MGVYPCDLVLSEAIDSFDGRSLSDESEVQEIVRKTVWPFFFGQTRTGSLLKRDYAITDGLQRRVAEEMAKRFGVTGELRGGLEYPGVYFASRLEQVIGDLIATKDRCLEPLTDAEQPIAHVQTEDEKFASIVEQVRADIGEFRNNQPGISSIEMEKKKNASRDYRRAFEYVMQSSVAAGYGKTLEPVAKPEAPSHVKQFAHMLNAAIQSSGVPRPAAGFVTIRANGIDYKYPFSEFTALSEQAVKFGLVL